MRRMNWLIALATLTLFCVGSAHAEEETPHPGMFGTSFLEGWKKSVAFGLSGTDGKTDEVKTITDLGVSFEDESFRHKLVAQFYLSDTDVGPTDKKGSVEFEENWKPFKDSFFLFAIGRYDYDRLESWDHRFAGSGGVGYEVISTEQLKVRLSAGGGANHTWDGNKETSPEGVLRFGADYNVMKGVSFATTHTYFPNFDQTSEYRIVSDAGLKADVAGEGGIFVGIGVGNEYDSLAIGANNDLTYYFQLRYEM